ncbi:MAG: hypothetical protein IT287_05575, partial [Bdellovibrionaceae bacterium]|nr:hypothetical protein [Pseudobdellovibrionaceae bacterium]
PMKIISLLFLIFFLVSCNSKVNEGVDVQSVLEAQKGCAGAECAVCELPWGGTLASGQTIDTVYSKSIVSCSEECSDKKIKLTCEEGVLKSTQLDGNFFDVSLGVHQKCYKQRCDCDQNGTVIEDGKEKDFFKLSTTSCTTNCESRKLRCRSGKVEDVLEPSKTSWTQIYKYNSCTHSACAACTTPWGQSVAHGQSTKGFAVAEVNCGQTCTSQGRNLICNNGSLTGADLNIYKNGTCTPKVCANCSLPSGDILQHGSTAPIYSMSQSTCLTSCNSNQVSMSCHNGVISGGNTTTYKFISCTPQVCATCSMPCGGTVASGGFKYCYKNTAPPSCGMTCMSERRKFNCDNGVVKNDDGSVTTDPVKTEYNKSSCNDIAACSSCALPDGRAVADGIKATFFKQKAVSCGQQCYSSTNSVALTCSNGTFANKNLYPDFVNITCEQNCDTGTTGDNGIGNVEGDGGGAPRHMCQLPWRGGVVTHKTRITAYSRMSVPATEKCSSYKRIIECNGLRGLWSGGASFIYPTCVEE